MQPFLVSWSVVGLMPKHELSAEWRFCCSMKFITLATGRNVLRGTGRSAAAAPVPPCCRHRVLSIAGSHWVARELGRAFRTVDLSHWSASSLTDIFQIPAHEAALEVVRFGSYPGAVALQKDQLRWRAYIKDAIINLRLAEMC